MASVTLGEEDLFSNLPDDCIFFVLTFVDWNSLEQLECVSQKLHFISRHNGYTNQRKAVREFWIEQWSGDYTIRVDAFYKDNYFLMYDEFRSRGRNPRGRYSGTYTNWCSRYSHTAPPGKLPSHLFKVLELLHVKYSPENLLITKIHLDQSFLQRLVSAFHGRIPDCLDLKGVSIDDKEDFSKFIFNSKIRQLNISYASAHVQAVFDAEFLQRFSQDRTRAPSLSVWPVRGEMIDRWTPSGDLLHVIGRFSFLELAPLTLTVELANALILIGFENQSAARMICLLDEPFQEQNLHNFNIAPYFVTWDDSTAKSFTDHVRIEYSRSREMKFSIKREKKRGGCDIRITKLSNGFCKFDVTFTPSDSA